MDTFDRDLAQWMAWFAALDLGWLEPVRDYVGMHALENASIAASGPDKIDWKCASATILIYLDCPEFAWEVFYPYNRDLVRPE